MISGILFSEPYMTGYLKKLLNPEVRKPIVSDKRILFTPITPLNTEDNFSISFSIKFWE